MEHTKGPWKVVERTERVPLGNRGEQTRHFLAIEQDIDSQFPAYIARIIKDSRSHELTAANARLIAQAPAMSKVLKYVVNWGHGFEGTGARPEWLTEAEEVLSKARGE